MLTREQRYAVDVLAKLENAETAEKAEKLDAGERKEYKAMAQEMPVLVRSAGLVQALTFLQSRSAHPHKLLLEHLASTLGFTSGNALVERSRTAPLPEYIRLTEQVIDALQWYKRLAQVKFK